VGGGAFAKLRKATISFVMSVRLTVCMENTDPTGRIIMTFDICLIFENLLGIPGFYKI
jgi:hypothetical protein